MMESKPKKKPRTVCNIACKLLQKAQQTKRTYLAVLITLLDYSMIYKLHGKKAHVLLYFLFFILIQSHNYQGLICNVLMNINY